MSARASALGSRARAAGGETPLRLVRRRSRRLITRSVATRVAPMALATAIGIAAIVTAILLEQVVLAQSAFHLSDLRTQLESAQARHEELLLESASLDSAARIERYARDVLGMVEPPPEAVRYIVADVGRGLGNRRRGPGSSAGAGPGVATGSPYAVLPGTGSSP